MKDGPIYHELETPSDEEALDDVATSPPIPSRDYPPPPPKPRDPVYERVGSLSKKYPPEGLLPAIEENSITRKSRVLMDPLLLIKHIMFLFQALANLRVWYCELARAQITSQSLL